jgi:lipid II:glycine glycyltransferase (peptidoglycan interpeptide bridge formation enzyme)
VPKNQRDLVNMKTIVRGTKKMNIHVIDPISDSRWDEFVDSQENSTIFHTSAWIRVIHESYGYTSYFYVLENEAGQIKAAIPCYLVRSRLTGKRLVSLPFSDYCWPLGHDLTDIKLLLDALKEQVDSKVASYLEIRGWQGEEDPTQLGLAKRDYHLIYLLDLESGCDIAMTRMHQSVRRGIKQAEKRGVTVRITRDEADLDSFYRINVATRKKLGVFPQPYSFFKSLFRNVISKDLGFMMLAEWEGKIIAGVVFLTYKNTIYYKFNASDEKHLQKRPNHLAIWHAVRYACDNNFKHCDFGRCSPEEEGLRTFKSRWGTEEIKVPYYYYPAIKGFTTVSESSTKYRMMRLFSHTVPKFLFRMVGSFMYKHVA